LDRLDAVSNIGWLLFKRIDCCSLVFQNERFSIFLLAAAFNVPVTDIRSSLAGIARKVGGLLGSDSSMPAWSPAGSICVQIGPETSESA